MKKKYSYSSSVHFINTFKLIIDLVELGSTYISIFCEILRNSFNVCMWEGAAEFFVFGSVTGLHRLASTL